MPSDVIGLGSSLAFGFRACPHSANEAILHFLRKGWHALGRLCDGVRLPMRPCVRREFRRSLPFPQEGAQSVQAQVPQCEVSVLLQEEEAIIKLGACTVYVTVRFGCCPMRLWLWLHNRA
jgi:hypothetical protein